MSEPYIGQIQTFPYNFAPRGWVDCNGQILNISQNTALFSLFGTTYGGDGRTSFGIPDLRGRTPLHVGRGPGLPDYRLGVKGGSPTETLTDQQIPSHQHTVRVPCNSDDGASDEPQNRFPAKAAGGQTIYASTPTAGAFFGTESETGLKGGGKSHENMQPYLVIRFCCALVGTYPSRS